ncbi:predicted protein [Histoplasma capsulatum G186AR]|uniref:Uncharacterized protein n=1 Tax=Ajellomyces capsulatus (strain G186AR / H82 / ATCC MYA-2454 / RMSCC 2432) TaxID=447093 RepID=C0NPT3_AJECG|nr:uncharacterized protein HCBG_05163 [Histoplasma capsulatum G186AR]EEH06943.1 predicted protein [Histoplasma capsulatum G186AR]
MIAPCKRSSSELIGRVATTSGDESGPLPANIKRTQRSLSGGIYASPWAAGDSQTLSVRSLMASTLPTSNPPPRGRVQQLQFYDIDTTLPSILEKFMDPTTGQQFQQPVSCEEITEGNGRGKHCQY